MVATLTTKTNSHGLTSIVVKSHLAEKLEQCLLDVGWYCSTFKSSIKGLSTIKTTCSGVVAHKIWKKAGLIN